MRVTAGRTEVVLDGYVLDPHLDGTYDLSRLELVALRRLVVERRLDLLRIEIETLEPFDPRAPVVFRGSAPVQLRRSR